MCVYTAGVERVNILLVLEPEEDWEWTENWSSEGAVVHITDIITVSTNLSALNEFKAIVYTVSLSLNFVSVQFSELSGFNQKAHRKGYAD